MENKRTDKQKSLRTDTSGELRDIDENHTNGHNTKAYNRVIDRLDEVSNSVLRFKNEMIREERSTRQEMRSFRMALIASMKSQGLSDREIDRLMKQ